MSDGLPIKLEGVEGIDKIIRRMNDPRVKAITTQHMNISLIMIETPAKVNAAGVSPYGYRPGGSGQGASSLTHSVGEIGSDIQGIVGSRKDHMKWQEYGTGLLYDGPPPSSGKKHWPPAAALETWAKRNGIASGWLVARAIGRRGGLRPKKFLRNAWEQSKGGVISEMNKILPEITRRMAGK